jgi:hypothetical protein
MDTTQQMHAVLLELMMLMHGTTQSWNPTTSGSRERDPRPPGEAHPIAEHYATAYAAASNEIAKRRVLHEARDELQAWRGHGTRRHAGETREELEDRILKDGRGFDAHTVAIRFDTNAGRIRKLRVANGCLPDTGYPLPGVELDQVRSPERVRDLHEQGYTLRQITTITKVSKSHVHRILGKAA